MKFGPVVQKEMSFKEKGRTDDGQKTDHNSSPSAQGELKNVWHRYFSGISNNSSTGYP